MPKRRSPDRLSQIARNVIIRRIADQIDQLLHALSNAEERSGRYWLSLLLTTIDELDILRRNIFNMEPSVSAQIIPSVIRRFNNQITRYKNRDTRCPVMKVRFEHALEHFSRVALEALLVPSLQEFNIKAIASNFAQYLSVQSLGSLCNITALTLPGRSKVFEAGDVEDKIQYLTKLQKFEFKYDCTTEVMNKLSQHCPHLREINCQYSRRVNDKCVDSLLKLEELHFIDLIFTSLTSIGYKKLLSSLKLTKISWQHMIDKILPDVPQEKKNAITVGAFRVMAADVLIEHCQNITELTLFGMVNSISDLASLPSLQVFALHASNFNLIKADSFFQRKGPVLKELRFFFVFQIKLSDITSNCSVLKKLEFHICTLNEEVENDYVDEEANEDLPHFKSVEHLKLIKSGSFHSYFRKLKYYDNLKYFYARDMNELTDDIIINALTAGRLRNLVEIIVEDCSVHNITAFLHLINKCDNISKLGNLLKIRSFTEDVIRSITRYIKDHNYDITLISQLRHYVRSNRIQYIPKPRVVLLDIPVID